ncbi:PPK2 family polyphosphate kinase [Cellulomonas dongxiuzhuiae]|uniref:PPK2 family polyphosphate kinase n=1 Tax=Cellulomonas dongxiuzhuiae TaxID=2819979 RepID=UPI001AAEA373|nr:PPK2 family polyphosphate kinase [Cellulomonas dongxiuzhuiae]MBO3088368.1 polyphosphate kinase 2 family protein [Cellulomonas dongxiuzhuiae]
MAKGSKKKKKDKSKNEDKKKHDVKPARKAAAKNAEKAAAKAAKADRKAAEKAAAAHEAAAAGLLARRDAVADLLRVAPGFRLADVDTGATPGFDGSRRDGEAALAAVGAELSDLQERLFAHGRTGGTRSVLLVLQGLDTAGKGGIVRHVVGLVDPQGVALRSFGVPTPEERRHHFLWRIRRALPRGGMIGVFDRSHYEDVLVARVDDLVAPEVWERRFDEINRFEAQAAAAGTTIVKVALWVSPDEQYRRLRERLERPDKLWKYDPTDVDVRLRRPAYEAAYQEVLDRTSTEVAPWYVVPADSKWYARLAVSALLHQALAGLQLDWPPADYDVDAELARLDATR